MLLALLNNASYLSGGKAVSVSGKELMGVALPYYISPAFAFVAYPNRNSVPFREFYQIPEAQTVVRGTLRYQGFPAFIKALVDIGFLDGEEKPYLTQAAKGVKWKAITAKALGVSQDDEKTLVEKIKSICKFPNSSEESRIISGLKWIGLFSDDEVIVRSGNLLDTLCGRLETLMAYEEGERDLVMLQHKFIVEWADGKTVCFLLAFHKSGS